MSTVHYGSHLSRTLAIQVCMPIGPYAVMLIGD